MIFNTINTDLDGIINKIGIFQTSIADLFNAFTTGMSKKSIKGFFNGLSAAKNSIRSNLTKQDIINLKAYNEELSKGTTKQTAYYRTMLSSSKAATELAENAAKETREGKVNLDNLTASANTSKVAMMGFKVATVAANMALTMGLSYGLQKIIEGLDYMVHIAEKVSEAANEAFEQAKAESDKSKEKVESLEDLIKKYEKLSELGINDTDSRQEAKDIQDEIVDLVGEQAKNLDLVNGKLDDEIVKLNEAAKIAAEQNLKNSENSYITAKDAKDKSVGQNDEGFEIAIQRPSKTVKNIETNKEETLEDFLQSKGFITLMPLPAPGDYGHRVNMGLQGTKSSEFDVKTQAFSQNSLFNQSFGIKLSGSIEMDHSQ